MFSATFAWMNDESILRNKTKHVTHDKYRRIRNSLTVLAGNGCVIMQEPDDQVNARLRRSRGKDIDAACGQLANKN
jgi:adenine C2-methylase RlmN of 23S rRNA A2503 and tRNA A37